MRQGVSKYHIKQQLLRLITWLMLFGLVYPLLAPWLDPSFAVRNPNHEHVYLEEVVPIHHHALPPQLTDHAHDAVPNPLADDIIFLPDSDSLNSSGATIIHITTLPTVIHYEALALTNSGPQYAINLFYTSPQTPPPKISLF